MDQTESNNSRGITTLGTHGNRSYPEEMVGTRHGVERAKWRHSRGRKKGASLGRWIVRKRKVERLAELSSSWHNSRNDDILSSSSGMYRTSASCICIRADITGGDRATAPSGKTERKRRTEFRELDTF